LTAVEKEKAVDRSPYRPPKHTLRIGVYPHADANSGIIRDILCCQIQGESDEVPVQPLQPVALARTENNEVLHKVCL
jgi:hypothetical protein